MIAVNPLLGPVLDATPAAEDVSVQSLLRELEEKGAVRLPALVSAEALRSMQETFAGRLRQLRWNNCDGYERTERLRLMVPDVLTLDQGFVDLALHPLVKAVLNRYLGDRYELCEAKGWKSLPTKKDFHGWHGDMWYDQSKITGSIPREVKLAFYLTDVKSGAFQYIAASHGRHAPRHLQRHDVQALPMDHLLEFTGPAGTAVLFDTSGIHRQGIPILEPRQAVFCNYHDPDVPLQTEDAEYYRYHPLLLNAAFLGNLGADDCRILGFGNKTNYQHGYLRKSSHRWFQSFMQGIFSAHLAVDDWAGKVMGKMSRLLGR